MDCYAADDGAELNRVRRVCAVVHDANAVLLGVLARALNASTENSASAYEAPRSAALGLRAAASSKKPFENSTFAFGPLG